MPKHVDDIFAAAGNRRYGQWGDSMIAPAGRVVRDRKEKPAERDPASKIRVVLVHYMDSAAIGGSLRVGELLGKYLESANVEAHFLFAYGGPGPIAREAGIACHFVSADSPRDFGAWRRLRSQIRAIRPDVIHFVNPVFWIALSLWDTRCRKVLHVHGPLSPSTAPFRDRFIWRAFNHLMHGYVCVSRNIRTKLLDANWATPERAFTIYNAVDCDHWAARFDRADARKRLALPQDKVILGMVCRLVPGKGCDDAVRLLDRLPESYHLAIAGDGPEMSAIMQLGAAKGLENRVHMLGLLDDARLAYSAVDNLLFLSRTESFGLLLAEAMAMGVPVVGLGGEGGYREESYPLVTVETAILLDRPDLGDIDSSAPERLLDHLAETIQELNRSLEKREPMAARAKAWVRERFGADHYVGLVTSLYRELLARADQS